MSDKAFNIWLQSRLTAHGFPVGLIDGDIGKATIGALKAFEKKHGLKIDGTADPLVVAALRASASAVTPKDAVAIAKVKTPAPPVGDAVSTVWPRQAEVPKFYGAVGENQVKVPIPFDMFLAWDKSTRIRAMTLHKKVAASAQSAFEEIATIYSAQERKTIGLDLFGGSLNVRRMRGGTSYSMHSWGIAIDFDPERNQLKWGKDKARLAKDDAVPFWYAWRKRGWLSLGIERNYDWMHVQAARL